MKKPITKNAAIIIVFYSNCYFYHLLRNNKMQRTNEKMLYMILYHDTSSIIFEYMDISSKIGIYDYLAKSEQDSINNIVKNTELNKISDKDFTRNYISFYFARNVVNSRDKMYIINRFVKLGNIAGLEWCMKRNFPTNDIACSVAAIENNIPVLEWLYDHYFPLKSSVNAYAASKGNLDIIRWTMKKGLPVDKYVFLNAYEYGHPHIIEWGVTNGFINGMDDINRYRERIFIDID
jgi:hypothetical protein